MKNLLLERSDRGGASFESSVALAVDSVVITNDEHPAGRNMAKYCLIGGIRLGQAAELASSFPEIKSIPTPRT